MQAATDFRRTYARLLAALGMVLMLAAGAVPARAAGDPAKVGYPNSIAATGDSITRAYNTGRGLFSDAPANSWSSGTSSDVNSHYSRILKANRSISRKNYNDARTGAKMVDLNGQVATVNGRGVEYVTILMGANDACTSSESTMTPVATFRSQFEAAMQTLSEGSPNARIYVVSIPDVYHLWNLLKNNSSARSAWSLYGICQSMLANPLSTAQADVDRRARVLQRVLDFNTQLAEVCAQYIHCRYDNQAGFAYKFATSDVSTRDYFHPSVTGQATIARETYTVGYDFTDQSAPVSTATTTTIEGGMSVSLAAEDAAGVAGIEYKFEGGLYIRYSEPVTVASGATMCYRAVDLNGNIEAAQCVTVP